MEKDNEARVRKKNKKRNTTEGSTIKGAKGGGGRKKNDRGVTRQRDARVYYRDIPRDYPASALSRRSIADRYRADQPGVIAPLLSWRSMNGSACKAT